YSSVAIRWKRTGMESSTLPTSHEIFAPAQKSITKRRTPRRTAEAREGPHLLHERVGEEADGEGADLLSLPRQRARQVDHDRQLRQLRRLKAQAPQANPPARPAREMADARDEDEDEGDECEKEKGISHPLESPVARAHGQDHQAEPQARGDELDRKSTRL